MSIRLEDIKNPKLRAEIRASMEGLKYNSAQASTLAKVLNKAFKNDSASPLESSFLDCWIRCGGQTLEREVPLVPGRLWRCDFFHEGSKVAIELEGFGKGHTNLTSFRKDAEKYLALTLMGYTVLRITRHLVTEETIKKIIGFINKKLASPRREHRSKYHE